MKSLEDAAVEETALTTLSDQVLQKPRMNKYLI